MSFQELLAMHNDEFREFMAYCEKEAAELGVTIDYFMEEWMCD